MKVKRITRKSKTITLTGSFQPSDLRKVLAAADAGLLNGTAKQAEQALNTMTEQGEPAVPMNRSLYPDNWEEIALKVKEDSGWVCEECLRPCRRTGESIPDFIEKVWEDGAVYYGDWWEGRGGAMKNDLYELVEAAPQRFTLTVAHLDHNPANCAPENLRALCSVCHLRYDAAHHAANAAATRRQRAEDAGQLSMQMMEE